MPLNGPFPARQIRESSGPTILAVGAVAAGQGVVRAGSSIVGTTVVQANGVAAGQTINGGTGSGEDLTLRGSNGVAGATGSVRVVGASSVDTTGGMVIGTSGLIDPGDGVLTVGRGIGVGTSGNLTTSCIVVRNVTATTGSERGFDATVQSAFSASGAGLTMDGIRLVVNHGVAQNMGVLHGIQANVQLLAGFSAGALTRASVMESVVTHASARPATFVDGLLIGQTITGAGVVTNWSQLRIEDLAGGTITNPVAMHQKGTRAHNRLNANTTIGSDAAPTAGFVLDVQGGAQITGNLAHTGPTLGVFGTPGIVVQTAVGSRAGNAALASLLTGLAAYGLVIDATGP